MSMFGDVCLKNLMLYSFFLKVCFCYVEFCFLLVNNTDFQPTSITLEYDITMILKLVICVQVTAPKVLENSHFSINPFLTKYILLLLLENLTNFGNKFVTKIVQFFSATTNHKLA